MGCEHLTQAHNAIVREPSFAHVTASNRSEERSHKKCSESYSENVSMRVTDGTESEHNPANGDKSVRHVSARTSGRESCHNHVYASNLMLKKNIEYIHFTESQFIWFLTFDYYIMIIGRNNARIKNSCFKIDAYTSAGFVINASRKQVNR